MWSTIRSRVLMENLRASVGEIVSGRKSPLLQHYFSLGFYRLQEVVVFRLTF